MSEPSVFDGCKYLYAEQLKGRRVELTISAVKPIPIVRDGGDKTMGIEVSFKETPKMLAVAGATVRRQLAMACDTESTTQMVGKRVTLYAVPSKRSISGLAIRVATANNPGNATHQEQ